MSAEFCTFDKSTRPQSVVFQRCDVRSTEDIEQAIQKSKSAWPQKTIGGLVHCAGVSMTGKVSEGYLLQGLGNGFSNSVESYLKSMIIT